MNGHASTVREIRVYDDSLRTYKQLERGASKEGAQMNGTNGRGEQIIDRFRSALLVVVGSDDLSWLQLGRYCLVFAGIGGLVIASFDPIVTSDAPFWLAVFHWTAHLFFAAVILIGTTTLATLTGLRIPWALIVAVCLLPFLLTPFSLAADALLDIGPDAEMPALGFAQLYMLELLSIAPPSIGLSAIMAVFAYRAAEITKRQRHAILSRFRPEPNLRSAIPVPHNLGDDLIRVEAQDHYVSVITADGNATLKLAFSECVEALEGFRGMQCHRSHWVRFRHIRKIQPAGSAYVCILDDGIEVPVSRRRYGELKRKL